MLEISIDWYLNTHVKDKILRCVPLLPVGRGRCNGKAAGVDDMCVQQIKYFGLETNWNSSIITEKTLNYLSYGKGQK